MDAVRHVLADADELAAAAAEWFVAALPPGAGPIRICLSGGSTPRRLYRLLAGPGFADRLPWRRLHWYWGDERLVPHDDPDSNFRMAREALLGPAGVPAAHIHPIPTEGLGPAEAARHYEQELQRAYGGGEFDPSRPLFDVTLLGLGPDGHTASLLPDSPVLDEMRAWVRAVESGRPQARITLTYPALNGSRAAAFLVEGAEKRDALRRVWAGDDRLPAARIRPLGPLHWFVDRVAAGAG